MWTLWLILAASIPEIAAADAADLLRKLQLPAGDYWVASNGLAQPLSTLAGDADRLGEVLLLRRQGGRLEPVGWFEVNEQPPADAFASATVLTVDGAQPRADARLSGSWLRADDGGLLAAPPVRLLLSFSDPAGVRSWQLTDSHPVSITDGRWQPGSHELTVRAEDPLGNAGQAATLSFEVDAQGPAIDWTIESELLAEGEQGPVYESPVTLGVSAEDPAGLAGLEVDQGSGWQAVDAGSSLSVEASEVRLRATDRLGNSTVREASWRYDLEAPLITVIAQGAELAERDALVLPVGGVVTVRVTDDGVGVDSASYRYNRNPPKPLPEAIRFVDRGWYQVQIRAVDRVGNERVRHFDVRTTPTRRRPERAAEAMGDGP